MRVGTSCCHSTAQSLPEDHPHACGDKTLHLLAFIYASESSPCVWGQDLKATEITGQTRIIPMRVGTRYLNRQIERGFQDHPHACGDKRYVMLVKVGMLGSSPCVWGQDRSPSSSFASSRIIPMRVGTRYLYFSLLMRY